MHTSYRPHVIVSRRAVEGAGERRFSRARRHDGRILIARGATEKEEPLKKRTSARPPFTFVARFSVFYCGGARYARRPTRVPRLSLYPRTCRRCTDKEGCPMMLLPSPPRADGCTLAPRRNDLFDIYSRALTLIKTTAGRSFALPFRPPPLLECQLPSRFFFLLSSSRSLLFALCFDEMWDSACRRSRRDARNF